MHIEMKDISKAFSGKPVLKNVEFMIDNRRSPCINGGKWSGEIDAHEDFNRCI